MVTTFFCSPIWWLRTNIVSITTTSAACCYLWEPYLPGLWKDVPTALKTEVCKILSNLFTMLSLSRLHLRTHDTYKCEPCDAYFQDSKDARKDLERHKQTKAHRKKLGLDTNSSLFVCPVEWCAKSMPRKDNLNRHIKSQHPGHGRLK
jgi:hypothetical protein